MSDKSYDDGHQDVANSLLVTPIQAELGIGDTAMGLLYGIAFALF